MMWGFGWCVSARSFFDGGWGDKKTASCDAVFEGLKFWYGGLGGGVEAELHFAALGVGFGFAADLLIGGLKGAEAADFLEDALGVEFVL